MICTLFCVRIKGSLGFMVSLELAQVAVYDILRYQKPQQIVAAESRMFHYYKPFQHFASPARIPP